MPIYAMFFLKPIKISSPEPEGCMMTLGLGNFCSIEDMGPTKFVQTMIRLTLTYLMSRSNLLA